MYAMELRCLVLQFVLAGFAAAATQDNVCYSTISQIKSFNKAVTFYTTSCPAGQLECPIQRNVVQYRLAYVNLFSCCDGWIASGNNCSTPCPDDRYGRNCSEICNCTAPNTKCSPVSGCQCDAGWKSPNCSSQCDPGSYGFKCSKNCACLNGAGCDPVTGQCTCTPGWTGPVCNATCPQGRYGAGCAENCSCQADRAVCHHVSGVCSCHAGWEGPDCDKNADLTTQDYRLMLVILPLVGGIGIIVAAFGAIMFHISKRHGKSKKRAVRYSVREVNTAMTEPEVSIKFSTMPSTNRMDMRI